MVIEEHPLSPVKHARLDRIFEHAKKSPNDFEYVTELLVQCVTGDPGNVAYVRAYIENLQKKYHKQKVGSLVQFKERAARTALKKALAEQHWDEVIQHGLKVLTVNPSDIPALTGMATAAMKVGHRQCELHYLQTAVAGAPKDPTCNRLYAIALSERGLIDQAIYFWHRVEEVLPSDEEVKRAIADLTMQKANSRGQFDRFEDNDVARKLRFRAQQEEELTREQRIQQKIQAEPNNIPNYLELAQLHVNNERYEEAENVLAQAYEASDGNLDIREKWEDVQLRRLRKNLVAATAPEDRKRLQQEYREKDVEVWRHRVERYPGHFRFKYELGYRYMLVGRYEEAIRELQAAQNDPPRKGMCLLALGQCLQHVKQYHLAMNYYESAIQEIPDRDAENRKCALYLAGRLAFALKDIGTAERHLTALASLDFSYRDSAALLEKIRQLHEVAASHANSHEAERKVHVFG